VELYTPWPWRWSKRKGEGKAKSIIIIEKIFPDDAAWWLSSDLSRSSPRLDDDFAQHLEMKATSAYYSRELLTSKSLVVFLMIISMVFVRSQEWLKIL
jgi:hypothetical protein